MVCLSKPHPFLPQNLLSLLLNTLFHVLCNESLEIKTKYVQLSKVFIYKSNAEFLGFDFFRPSFYGHLVI